MTRQARVLITGAGGFVCRHIVDALLSAGYTVFAVDQDFDPDLVRKWKQTWKSKLEIRQDDIFNISDEEVDYIIHGAALTASPKESGLAPENHLRANLEPTLFILEWAVRNQAQRAVCISSDAIFSSSNGAISETHPATPDNLYAIAKTTTENLVQTLRRSYERDLVSIRLGSVYGPGEHSRASRPCMSVVAQMVEAALHHRQITVRNPETINDWTFAPDIGQVVCQLLAAPILSHALYNVASEQSVTYFELARTIAKQINDVQIVLDEEIDPISIRQGYLSHQRLLNEIGFNQWTSMEDGLAQVIEYQHKLGTA